MRRTLLAAGVLFSACLANSAGIAGDKAFHVVISPAAHRPSAVAGSTAKRKRIEQQLQAPLDLPLKGRETITLAELIEHVRTKHRIAIRFDAATLRTLLSDDSFDIPDVGCPPTVCTPATCAPAACGPTACMPLSCAPKSPTAVSGQTLPSAYYLRDEIQYFPAAAEFRLSNGGPVPAASAPASAIQYGPEPLKASPNVGVISLMSTGTKPEETQTVILQGLIANSAASVAIGRAPVAQPVVVGATIQGVTLEFTDAGANAKAAATQPATFTLVADGALPAALAVEESNATDVTAACPACPLSAKTNEAAVAEVPAKGAWHTSFEKARAEASSRKVPLVVQFEATWCGPCRKMAKVLESPDVLKALETDCVGVRVNVDQSPELVSKYNVNAIPTTVIVHPNGTRESMHFQASSAITEPAYLALLKSRKPVENASEAPAAACCAAASCPADCPVASCCPKSSDEACEGKASVAYAGTTGIDSLRHTAVSVESLSLEDASIESALNQMLEALTPAGSADELGAEMGLPVRLTCANDLAYLVVDDGVLVTTRMTANLRKETRIYRVPMLPNCPTERVAQILTHTVRPWSWRSQVNEMAEKLAAKCATPNVLGSLVQGYYSTAIQMAGGVTPQVVANGAPASPAGTASTDAISQAAAGVGQLAIHGAATLFQGGLSALEMVHHGDPPTAVIETLPGMLIITQSQAAHREIADFLEQLQEVSLPQMGTQFRGTYGGSEESSLPSPPRPHFAAGAQPFGERLNSPGVLSPADVEPKFHALPTAPPANHNELMRKAIKGPFGPAPVQLPPRIAK
ncbi:MAG: thioredoxin family protein [Planctomycetaceae bacterium]|nr:thioredoxin family protein [Planctomycetaceae bacterium]